ncbi:MAG: histidine phosphatase family protein [Pseudomonadota bacterium]
MRIHFIRHCPVIQDEATPAETWQLAPETSQAEKVLRTDLMRLDFDCVISSPESKALKTAERLLGKDQPVELDERLRELQRSGYIEDYQAQVAAVFEAPGMQINGWESASACQERSMAALIKLLEKRRSQILLFGHGLQGALLRALCLGQSLAELSDWAAINSPDLMIVDMAASGQLTMVEDFRGIASN